MRPGESSWRQKPTIGAGALGGALLAVSGFLPWVRSTGGMTIGWPFRPSPVLLLGAGALLLVVDCLDANGFDRIARTVGAVVVLGALVLTCDAVTNDSWRPAAGLLALALAGAFLLIRGCLGAESAIDDLLP